jgi:hypothetical protein
MTKYVIPTKEELETAIAKSSSIKEVLIALGRPVNNGGYQTIKSYAAKYGIELPKMDGKAIAARNLVPFKKIPENEYFATGVKRNNRGTYKRLVDLGYEEVCSECSMPPTWNGRPLCLQIDHINGDSMDNRLDNLRILCPNCHTQTETYANSRGRV